MNNFSASRPWIIAVDGHSSCGKSTFAKAIARHLQYSYIDSGSMYRSVTWFAIQNGWISDLGIDKKSLLKNLGKISIQFRFNPETGLNETWLNETMVERDIRDTLVSSMVSEISAIPEVRHRMVAIQREMGRKGGIVMDGRDIGTVVFPQAEIKIFMTADLLVRAQRRYDELISKKMPASFEDIRKNLEHRDYLDSTRTESPLKKAEDAIVLDNSKMTPDQQMEWFKALLEKRKKGINS